ncbi:hypothetical protein D3C81_1575230 [compost metagenome]
MPADIAAFGRSSIQVGGAFVGGASRDTVIDQIDPRGGAIGHCIVVDPDLHLDVTTGGRNCHERTPCKVSTQASGVPYVDPTHLPAGVVPHHLEPCGREDLGKASRSGE